jgi:hypothetical protein
MRRHITSAFMSASVWAVFGSFMLPAAPSVAQNASSNERLGAMKTAATRALGGLTFDSVYDNDLTDCGSGALSLGLGESDPSFQEAATAAYSVLLRKKLSGMGLADTGEPYIRKIEQLVFGDNPRLTGKALDDAKAKTVEEMARVLNAAIKSKHLDGNFTINGGCGAGEVKYQLVPSDPSARLFVIKQFYFQVCEARGVEPFDQQKCAGWQEATGRNQLSGAGIYKYSATWPDGKVTTGDFPITDRVIDGIDNAPQKSVVTIPIQR